jgi:hypothetical protein
MDSDTRSALSAGVIALIIIVALVVVGGIITLVGWQANWWFAVHNAQRQEKIINQQSRNNADSFGAQEGYLTQLSNDISAVTGASGPQATADANQACQVSTLITGTVPESSFDISWVRGNCQGGAVSPSSVYAP